MPTIKPATLIEPTFTADVESSSSSYQKRFTGSVGKWFLETQNQLILQALPTTANKLNIIDIGGGHAQISPLLAELGHQVTVVGSKDCCSHLLIDHIQKERLRFQVADFFTLPFNDKSFDIVICLRLLSHCKDYQKLVAELCRVSKNTVIFDYPSKKSFNILSPLLLNLKKLVEKDTRKFSVFKDDVLWKQFNQNGFYLAERNGQFFWPMAMHRLFNCLPFSFLIEKPFKWLGMTKTFGTPTIAVMRKNPL